MNLKLISIVIGILLVVGIGVAIYFYNGKNKVENSYAKPEFNISFNFIDSLTKKQVSTGYVLYINGILNTEGTTTLNDYVRLNIPSNSTFTLINKNLKDENYYTSKYEYIDINQSSSNLRLTLELQKYGNLELGVDHGLTSSPIKLNLLANGEVKNIILCLRWSNNIITSNIANEFNTLTIVTPPTRYYNKADRCYNTFTTLNSNGTQYYLNYKPFDILDNEDFIKIIAIDGDSFYPEINNIKYEDNNTDILIKDVELIIK